MDRRAFVTGLGAVVAAPLATEAQRRRASPSGRVAALHHRNLVQDRRPLDQASDDLATELRHRVAAAGEDCHGGERPRSGRRRGPSRAGAHRHGMRPRSPRRLSTARTCLACLLPHRVVGAGISLQFGLARERVDRKAFSLRPRCR